ncbi:MAG: DUF2933 domain-containing protein [Patescibacteria group bacterium]|nr:DUF2933 domain-containing protein [Actinomycetota bacterium]MCL5438901.1 DUF2933 domain-containing protein [Patescibacteria group bacterium]
MESLKFIKGKLLMICIAVFAITVVAITVFKVSIGNLFFFAVLLACPLMHLFMMKGHGDHKKKDNTKGNGKSCH